MTSFVILSFEEEEISEYIKLLYYIYSHLTRSNGLCLCYFFKILISSVFDDDWLFFKWKWVEAFKRFSIEQWKSIIFMDETHFLAEGQTFNFVCRNENEAETTTHITTQTHQLLGSCLKFLYSINCVSRIIVIYVVSIKSRGTVSYPIIIVSISEISYWFTYACLEISILKFVWNQIQSDIHWMLSFFVSFCSIDQEIWQYHFYSKCQLS